MIEQRAIDNYVKVVLLADLTIVIEKKTANTSQGVSLSCSQAEQVIEAMKELIKLRYEKYA